MIFSVAASPAQADINVAESRAKSPPSEVVAKSTPDFSKRTVYTYHKRIIPIEGGSLLLRLNEKPKIALDQSKMECEVLGWDIFLPVDKVELFPREMARQFLKLFSLADADQLNNEQREQWLRLLDQVDFQTFSVDRAAPHYMEGEM